MRKCWFTVLESFKLVTSPQLRLETKEPFSFSQKFPILFILKKLSFRKNHPDRESRHFCFRENNLFLAKIANYFKLPRAFAPVFTYTFGKTYIFAKFCKNLRKKNPWSIFLFCCQLHENCTFFYFA